MDEILNGKNYLRNIKTSRERTVRLEIVGGVNETERHFIEGTAFFAAGTLSKNDNAHTKYVADMMAKLIKQIVTELRDKKVQE